MQYIIFKLHGHIPDTFSIIIHKRQTHIIYDNFICLFI